MRYASIRNQDLTRVFLFLCLVIFFGGSVHHDVFVQSKPLKKTVVNPLILDQFGSPISFVETSRCKIKTKTVIFYVDTNIRMSSLQQEITKLCDSINKIRIQPTALDFDRDGVVEVRIANLKSNNKKLGDPFGLVFINDFVKYTNEQRDILYLHSSLFSNPQRDIMRTEVTFLHENQHLRQFYQYFCSTMRQCDANKLNTGIPQFAPEVRVFIEGDAVRESCRYLPADCRDGAMLFVSTTNVQRDATCFTALDDFGYICAYRLVEKINSDFKKKLKPAYKDSNINPILEALKKKNALTSLPLFKKALDEVFKKYTTISTYDVYRAERDMRSSDFRTLPEIFFESRPTLRK